MTPQELKNSILQLAIQGKLVEQRPEEGTADELFTQIQEAKQRLIAEKKIKKEKPLPEITEDEKPFDIPESWMWVRHNELFEIIGGSQPPKSKFSDIKRDGYVRLYQIRDYGEKPVPVYVPKQLVSKFSVDGDILLARYGGSLGKVFWAKAGAYNVAMAKVKFLFEESYILKTYIYYYYLAPLYQKLVGNSSRSAQAGFNKDDLNNLMFPLPPLAEQKRIVAKIEELLPYIDRYEQAWSKLEQFNSRFPEDMKKSLLQYAIQGKLVEQRPEEGTAEELFAQIQQEKQRLIAEKKIKKEKSLPEITGDEKPFDIPESWKWVRVGSLLHYIDTGKSFKCDEIPPTNDKCGIIKVSAVTWGQFKENESKTCYSNDLWVDEYAIHENDFLICRANTAALVGGCVIVDQISKRLMLSDKVLRLHFSEMLYSYYVLWALRTPMVRNQFSAAATGTSESMKNISQDMIKNTLIPLPPLDEQKRIVEKLEQLLPLCEKLQS